MANRTIKIHQLAFIRDLVIEVGIINFSVNVIFMKTSSYILMTDPKDYNETILYMYEKLVEKLIYLLYGKRSDIVFVVKLLNRYNTNLKRNHL